MTNPLESIAPEGQRKAHITLWADSLLFTLGLVLGLMLHETSIPLACITAIGAITGAFLGLNSYENKQKNGNGNGLKFNMSPVSVPSVFPTSSSYEEMKNGPSRPNGDGTVQARV